MATLLALNLNKCVSYAITRIRQQVKKKRNAHPHKKHKITDYPSMVVACGYVKRVDTFWSQSASPINYHYSHKIEQRLEERLGIIGSKRNGCKNIIGACAEPHAADKVIKAFPGCKLGELQFSDAYRPRTAQRKKNCQNCKDAFPEVL